MQLGFIIILIIAIFVAIFAIQNGAPVPVDLFLARYEIPLAVVMMACLILGAVIVLLLGTVRSVKKRSETKELKSKLKSLENDKILLDSNAKAMELEILSLKENNSTLAAKVTELEEKNKEQSDTILTLYKENESKEKIIKETKETNGVNEVEVNEAKEELTNENNKISTEYAEGAGFEINNEKSEANTN